METTARANSLSPPPNCPICLSHCRDKCYTNSCMHQFCFVCLVEWSKVKAECPLCKQQFNAIFHNIRGDNDYDEHVVDSSAVDVNLRGAQPHPSVFITHPPNHYVMLDTTRILDGDARAGSAAVTYASLPLSGHTHSNHSHPESQYQFRSTVMIETDRNYPLPSVYLSHPYVAVHDYSLDSFDSSHYVARSFRPSRRGHFDTSASFRNMVYRENLWSHSTSDLTGRFREVTPEYFRTNPSARCRLVPWLNREVNSLFHHNTLRVMELVDLILTRLLRYHICSRRFRDLLRSFFGQHTEHFVHELYNFMRSPFDMVGYDRNVIYSDRAASPLPYVEDDPTPPLPSSMAPPLASNLDSSTDDVILVGEVGAQTSQSPQIIDVIDLVDNSDEGDIVTSRRPVEEDSVRPLEMNPACSTSGNCNLNPLSRSSLVARLPLKLRLKSKRRRRRRSNNQKVKRPKGQCIVIDSTSSSSSLSSLSASSPSSLSSSSSSPNLVLTSDNEDSVPSVNERTNSKVSPSSESGSSLDKDKSVKVVPTACDGRPSPKPSPFLTDPDIDSDNDERENVSDSVR